ncbi:hypothetical protein [Mycobacterium colombiense]|uniref:hypothetical protein n=1 Tax=Mycobacterium colombiense TaxID=339268 RepID=UPI0020A383DF|nr:hypothetical protein [Mycobacterium colombiense]
MIVVGSQAILGTYPEYELPTLATRSLEIDILPITDDNNVTIELADLIVSIAGELSPFQQTLQYIGWCLDKQDLCAAKLCAFWEKDRNFVDALIDADLVEPEVIDDRVVTVPARYSSSVERTCPCIALGTNRI